MSHQNFSHTHHTHNIYNSNETHIPSNTKCEATALLTVNHQHITYNYPIYHAPASAVLPTNSSVLTSPKPTTESAVHAHHVCENSSPVATIHSHDHGPVNPYNTQPHNGSHEHAKTTSYHSHHYHSSPHVMPNYGSDTSLCYNNNCDNVTSYNSNLNGTYEYDLNSLRHAGGTHLTLHDLPNATQQPQTATISEPAEFINYSDLKYSTRALTHSLANEISSTEPEFINYSELKHYPHIMESTATTAVQQEIKPTKLLHDEEANSAITYNETPSAKNPQSTTTTSYQTCYYASNSNSSNSTRNSKLEKIKDKYLLDATTNQTSAYEYEHHHYGGGGTTSSNYFSNIPSTTHNQNTNFAGINNYYDTGTSLSSLQGPPQQNHTTPYDFSSTTSSYASTYGYDQMNARSPSLMAGPPCHTYAH